MTEKEEPEVWERVTILPEAITTSPPGAAIVPELATEVPTRTTSPPGATVRVPAFVTAPDGADEGEIAP